MTENQYREYKIQLAKIEPIKDLMEFCGNRYHKNGFGFYDMRMFKIKRRFGIGRKGAGYIETTSVTLPNDLQDRIVDTVEQWLDEEIAKMEEL